MSAGTPAGLGLQGVMALRAQILQRSTTLQQAVQAAGAVPVSGVDRPAAAGFVSTLQEAVRSVNALQEASADSAARWERGETNDIAAVMLSRQKASLAFEATLQARNRLLSAYRDIMNMPV